MTSFCSSVCLLVLLGVLTAQGNPAHTRMDNVDRIQEELANQLGLKGADVSTRPLFYSVISSIKASCQRKDDFHLMNVTLDVYLNIFSSILDTQSPTLLDQVSNRPHVESNLKKLQQKVQEIKRRLNHQSQMREDELLKLHEIKVDDPEIQKRALAQLSEIIHVASAITSRGCGSAHSYSTQ